MHIPNSLYINIVNYSYRSFHDSIEKVGYTSIVKEIQVYRERRIFTGDGFVRLSIHLSIHSSRLETES